MKLTIATALCIPDTNEKNTLPQLRGKGADEKLAIYWKAATCLMASAHRANPNLAKIVITNVSSLPESISEEWQAVLTSLGVKVLQTPFTFSPPKGTSSMFQSAFFKFDALRYLSQNGEEGAVSLLLDCDCIISENLDSLTSSIQRNGPHFYDIYGSPDPEIRIHSISREDLRTIYSKWDNSLPETPPIWFGGEFYGSLNEDLKTFISHLNEVYEVTCRYPPERWLFPGGKKLFDNDELISAYAAAKMGISQGLANPFIKRIWTQVGLRNIAPGDLDLPIWHLPHEKAHGLTRLFTQVIRPNSSFWTIPPGPDFKKYLGSFFGLPAPSLGKNLQDYWSMAKNIPRLIHKSL